MLTNRVMRRFAHLFPSRVHHVGDVLAGVAIGLAGAAAAAALL